jgi:YidC/Oxa1 family membrane protein insertase
MDTKTIIAFALMILIYFMYFSPQPPKKPAEQQKTAQTSQETQKSDSVEKTLPKTKADSKFPAGVDWRPTKKYELENSKVRLTIDSFGSVYGAEFFEYSKEAEGDERVKMDFNNIRFNDSFILATEKFSQWKVVSAEGSRLTLSARNKQLTALRTVELLPDSYVFQIKDEIKNKSQRSAKVGLTVRLGHPIDIEEKPPAFWKRIFQPGAEIKQVAVMTDGSVDRHMLSNFSERVEATEMLSWTGFSHKYFFYGMIPVNVSLQSVVAERASEREVSIVSSLSKKQIDPGQTTNYTYNLYIGPSDIPQLTKAGTDLSMVVDYGDWIGPISRVLLSILHFFYGLIPNYGLAIILLTMMVKVVLFPLAYKAAVSMRRMQVVAPKMKEIKEKYKKDPKRVQQEVMGLYKNEKVNPLGSCLPMLLQMPVFFALYRLFFASIELRHEPFFGWIQDLSSHDPWFVTPILMTALMWGQQKITPMPNASMGGEETDAMRMQKSMMKWMPVMFGFIMLFLPAGLTLYFLINALISVVQQYYLNKHLHIKLPMANVAVGASA